MSESQLQEPHPMFDDRLTEMFRQTIEHAFLAHGDVLRSVGIFFDYHGTLNEAGGVVKGMWMGPHGAVATPEGIVGSEQACMRLLEQILGTLVQYTGNVELHLQELLKKILENAQNEQAKEGQAPPAQAEKLPAERAKPKRSGTPGGPSGPAGD